MMPSAPWRDDEARDVDQSSTVSGSVVLRLYVSHALSAWNSRLFEFGSTLFLTSIYPDTLMPVSIYALVRAASAILLSPAVGVWIDREDRLVVAKVSIIGQRVAVALSCAVFLILESDAEGGASGSPALFTLIVLLAGVEKLSAVMNAVSVTRDWVSVSYLPSSALGSWWLFRSSK
jgi:iron-regulated transporter 1